MFFGKRRSRPVVQDQPKDLLNGFPYLVQTEDRESTSLWPLTVLVEDKGSFKEV